MTRAVAVLMLMTIGSAAGTASSARVQVTPMDSLPVRVVEATTAGTMKVELRNNSKEAIRVFRESNTWGAARWRVLRLKDGRAEAFAQTARNRYFTRNVPAFDEIPAGGRLEVRLDINDGGWLTAGNSPARFQAGDSVVAMYDVPPTPEGQKLGVWHGIAAAVATVR